MVHSVTSVTTWSARVISSYTTGTWGITAVFKGQSTTVINIRTKARAKERSRR